MESNDKKMINQKKLKNSFRYALDGIITAYQEEQNLRIHTIVAMLVIIFGITLRLSVVEFSICLILIGLVLTAEFFNTAVENMVDMITLDKNPYAKKAKDIAAAGVLVFAVTSSIIGLIIFLPKVIHVISKLI